MSEYQQFPVCVKELIFFFLNYDWIDSKFSDSRRAMGTKMGPSYANLFVGFIKHQFFSQHHGPKPELYNRYIDDWIGATPLPKRSSLNL